MKSKGFASSRREVRSMKERKCKRRKERKKEGKKWKKHDKVGSFYIIFCCYLVLIYFNEQ